MRKKTKNGWKITKEFKTKSETIATFATEREADKYARNFMKDYKDQKC